MTLRAPAELLYAAALQVLSVWFRIISGNMNACLSIIGIYWAGCLPAITIFSMRRPGELGHFWPAKEGNLSEGLQFFFFFFLSVVKRMPVGVLLCPIHKINLWIEKEFWQWNSFSPWSLILFLGENWRILTTRLCTERLNQQVKVLIKNIGWWVFILIFFLEDVLLFCFVMVWIYFGPVLFSILLLELSAFPLWLKISLPQLFHFKNEGSIWKDHSIQLT